MYLAIRSHMTSNQLSNEPTCWQDENSHLSDDLSGITPESLIIHIIDDEGRVRFPNIVFWDRTCSESGVVHFQHTRPPELLPSLFSLPTTAKWGDKLVVAGQEMTPSPSPSSSHSEKLCAPAKMRTLLLLC